MSGVRYVRLVHVIVCVMACSLLKCISSIRLCICCIPRTCFHALGCLVDRSWQSHSNFKLIYSLYICQFPAENVIFLCHVAVCHSIVCFFFLLLLSFSLLVFRMFRSFVHQCRWRRSPKNLYLPSCCRCFCCCSSSSSSYSPPHLLVCIVVVIWRV